MSNEMGARLSTSVTEGVPTVGDDDDVADEGRSGCEGEDGLVLAREA